MEKIKVGITGVGSLIGQAIIKSIKISKLAKNISTIGFDYFKDTVGSYWVDKNFLLPDILSKEVKVQEWLDKIIDIIRSEQIKIFLIGVDFELEILSQYKDMIESETQCKLMLSDKDPIRIAVDKYLTYKFLKDNGLNYPETFLPDELCEKGIRFPCFVKPRRGSRSRDTFIVADKKQLDEILPRVNGPIIQELIGNPNVEYTCGVICFNGEVKESIVLRRDLKDGNTVTAYYSKDTPEIIYSYIRKTAEALKPFGVCNFQLRLDDNRSPKIFEINARHSGTTYIRSLFGFNEVEYIISYMLGWKIEKFRLREGMVKRYYDEMFIGS